MSFLFRKIRLIFKSVFKKKRRTPQEKNSVIYYLLCFFNGRPSLHMAMVIPQPTGPPTTGSVPVFRPEAFPKKFLTRNALDFVSNSQNRRFVENLAPGWANADLHKRKACPFFFRNFWESVPFGQIRIRCHSSASVRAAPGNLRIKNPSLMPGRSAYSESVPSNVLPFSWPVRRAG